MSYLGLSIQRNSDGLSKGQQEGSRCKGNKGCKLDGT
ncbi:hypothetical protein JOD02_000861 [Caldicoprobacter guelmensis]|nr:hypothetical protein [Caldicoprobacter guelmensis]